MSVWFITGASSGLGRSLAEKVLEAGHQVVATARDISALDDVHDANPGSLLAATLDLTETDSLRAAVTAAHTRFGCIDVLVNNAGYGYTAAVEEGRTEDVARLFATNFFGPVELIKAVLPGMRAQGAGTIVNISSIGARAMIPGGGYYSAAKAALEGLSGAMRKEVEPLGLRVLVVEPGSFRTDFRGRSADHSDIRVEAYDEVLGRTGSAQLSAQRGDPKRAATAILEAVEHPEPPSLLILGTDALAGFHASTAADAADVERFSRLTRSTDADS
ncbi:oxidoreductase [Microbacterium invictum]|uniref:NAD(P)-dependent dehydrogenase (Short-subunit alcohol dehydrogenase family) n=1 Tax=Microbacterium invictum TaxID=515415 RepID=A0AA40SS85_9MICO|nr:oxidoreductase [Microbacterium invictum]MBB4141311.1 NAD(P)-dependent dehydrogenase (short-subunit alcohol dehydrogenase family) [Microbacterium invictum]